MKTIAVVLLFVAFAAAYNWNNFNCAQLQTMTISQANQLTCSDWATVPDTKVNCFTMEVACSVLSRCYAYIPQSIKDQLTLNCGGGGTLVQATTGAPLVRP